MPPAEPGKKPIGMNTASSTRLVAMIAPVSWPIALAVAGRASSCSSRMMRSTFSTMTMASSLRMPIATTIANSDNRLIDMPNASRPRQVPINEIGTTSVGSSIARQLCRNSSTTMETMIIASIMVRTTPFTDSVMNGVVSNGVVQRTSGGNVACSACMRWRTWRAVASALAPLLSDTARPALSCPLRLRLKA